MANPKCRWQCPDRWSEWSEWPAAGLHVRNRWRLSVVLVELWAWDARHDQLCDRGDSPRDDAARRPSHADRRKALRQRIMQNELSKITAAWRLPREIIQLAQRLMALAA